MKEQIKKEKHHTQSLTNLAAIRILKKKMGETAAHDLKYCTGHCYLWSG